MIAKQASRQARLEQADDVINNDGDEDVLTARVASLNEKYRALSRQTL
jgi:dephospho-CoA kinase